MLTITQDQAEKIAFTFLSNQENKLDAFGGYPGELFVVRDMLVFFYQSGGEKRDGASVEIKTVESAIGEFDEAIEFWPLNEIDGDDWRKFEANFGESVPSLAKYLMTCDGGPDEYSAGCPYKEDAPAVLRFLELAQSR